MSKRDDIWRRACRWSRKWQAGKSRPTPAMAYLAGWQACERERRKLKELRTATRKQPKRIEGK